MSRIKFKHVFAVLMLLSAAAAFAVPSRYTAKAQPQVQRLFTPVAGPVRSAAGWAHDRLATPPPPDPRDPLVLATENENLREQLAAAQHELAALKRQIDERADVGDVFQACTPIKVDGEDAAAGSRDGLMLRGSTFDGLKEGQAVLFGNSIAGRIERPPGVLGAQVRLVTDRGMRVDAFFGRPEKDDSGKFVLRRLGTSAVLVEGIGGGAMRCATALTMEEVGPAGAKLAPGDWVLLEDKEWDDRIHGRLIGRVVRVAPQTAAPLYADIRIEPTKNLSMLREVMVLTK